MDNENAKNNVLKSVKRGYGVFKLLKSDKRISTEDFDESMITQLIIDIINLKVFDRFYSNIDESTVDFAISNEIRQDLTAFTETNAMNDSNISVYENLLGQLILIKAKGDTSKIKKLYEIYMKLVNFEWDRTGWL
jgi:hypothetical protein